MADVLPDGPAAKAGIKSGDVIIAFNSKSVLDSHGLQLAVSDCAPGSTATLNVIRDGIQKNFAVTLAPSPGQSGDNSATKTVRTRTVQKPTRSTA